MAPATPERFGDYDLVERLGVCGMAETFVAIRRGPAGFEQRVCLKRILPTFVNDADFVQMFLREARMSALLHHGHIARVLDSGVVDGAHYLALELIEGVDLRTLLRHLRQRGESLGPGLTSYVAHALASALDFAHTADDDGHATGIIHRDVSPSNVLLSNAGEIKLADFGIAKAMNLPGSIQSGALKGKVPYLALMNETSSLDGFSPIGGIVIELSAGPDTDSLPLTPQAALEPSATVGLFDLTPGSETFGQQVPFQLTPISRALQGQEIDHCLVLYPSIPLSSKGRYAVVVTRAARADDGRSFEPSPFMTAVLGPAQLGEAIQITQARELLSDGVLDVLADDRVVSPPIEATDIALVFRITVRSTDDIPLTPLSMKAQILSRPPPSYTITSVSPGVGPVAAVVRGTWQAPNWRENQYFISRDENGDPQITGSLSVDFVLALPVAAQSGPVPVVMFQHGSPGSAEQVYAEALGSLAEAGFAVIGFTDTLNREIGQDLDQQNLVLFQTLVTQFRFPHFPMQTYGEQMAFLRIIEQLGSLDRIPLPNGDGVPDLDLEAPLTYVGLSMGSVHGSAFLPYAPEIKAAALSAGAQRQAEQYFSAGAFIDSFPPALKAFLPHATPLDYWVGLSIFQMIFDHQDAHHHAAHLYRDRLQVAGTMRKASVLLAEGVADTRMPNSLTRSLAWTFGPIPHLQPIWESTPILQPITGPVTANIDSETTAAFYQFVPAGIPGIPPTPGCVGEPEGHYCAQDAAEARRQRALFLRSAIEDPVPTITDPLELDAP